MNVNNWLNWLLRAIVPFGRPKFMTIYVKYPDTNEFEPTKVLNGTAISELEGMYGKGNFRL